MDDLISRQAAIDALEREKTYCTAFRDGCAPINVFEKYNAGLTDGIKALKKLPSAQPERKMGKWIRSGEGSYEVYECSSCGKPWLEWWASAGDSDWMSKKLKYCPNCGADMREEQTDDPR